jgi:hypothetical protein
MAMKKCPTTNLLLPEKFIDEKKALKKSIDNMVEDAINEMGNETRDYLLVFHARFAKHDPSLFQVSTPIATFKIPPFTANQMVYYVSPKRGLCELLWMVSPNLKGEKITVEFNKEGVANLHKKGVMPSLEAV